MLLPTHCLEACLCGTFTRTARNRKNRTEENNADASAPEAVASPLPETLGGVRKGSSSTEQLQKKRLQQIEGRGD